MALVRSVATPAPPRRSALPRTPPLCTALPRVSPICPAHAASPPVRPMTPSHACHHPASSLTRYQLLIMPAAPPCTLCLSHTLLLVHALHSRRPDLSRPRPRPRPRPAVPPSPLHHLSPVPPTHPLPRVPPALYLDRPCRLARTVPLARALAPTAPHSLALLAAPPSLALTTPPPLVRRCAPCRARTRCVALPHAPSPSRPPMPRPCALLTPSRPRSAPCCAHAPCRAGPRRARAISRRHPTFPRVSCRAASPAPSPALPSVSYDTALCLILPSGRVVTEKRSRAEMPALESA
ncbi:hypothetical protein DENSPDRAFT_882048 [Dentipellis sp. KUC8613]|nr:hypothetical protein DENSPDRAFT_882048 [Dentipellis sp. KUC8613]